LSVANVTLALGAPLVRFKRITINDATVTATSAIFVQSKLDNAIRRVSEQRLIDPQFHVENVVGGASFDIVVTSESPMNGNIYVSYAIMEQVGI
jgi:hypothetical protein